MATILLAYALARFVVIPEQTISLQIPGVFLVFRINFQTIVSVLVAALAASGMEWLLRDHPEIGKQTTFPHWIVPALTAMVIGTPLATLADGPQWWIVFGLGGMLLGLVFVAEYIIVDPSDLFHPLATAGLTALSFTLFLLLAITVRASDWRLYLTLPAIIPAAALVSLRTLYLRLNEKWSLAWAIGISLFVGQIAAALHYWRIGAVPYGLLLLGPTYALTSLAGGLEEGRPVQGWLIEPLVMLGVVWGLAVLLI